LGGCKTRIGLVCLEKFRPIMNLIKLEFEDNGRHKKNFNN
jgi:hypothetical protein